MDETGKTVKPASTKPFMNFERTGQRVLLHLFVLLYFILQTFVCG